LDDNVLKDVGLIEPEELQPCWKNQPSFKDLYNNYVDAQSDQAVVIADLDRRELYLDGGPMIKVPKGKSSTRPKLIRKQLEWKIPALEEPFLNTVDMFQLKPRTFEDVDKAKQNELLINYQWSTKVDKVRLINNISRTIATDGIVIVKTGWETDEEEVMVDKEVPVYASPEESLQIIQQALESGEMSEEQAQQIIESGQPVQKGTEVVQVPEYKLVKNQPMYTVCDTRNVILDPTANGVIEDLQFVIHEYDTTLSDLKREEYYEECDENGNITSYGIYKNLDLIEPATSTRDYENDVDYSDTSFEFGDKPRRKLRAYEYWGYWDINGDGQTEVIVATWVGKTLIRLEKSPYPFDGLPFSIASYMPVKNSFYGETDGDLLIENQNAIGRMTRAMYDITADIAVGQEFIDETLLSATQKANYKAGRTVYTRAGMSAKNSIYKSTIEDVPRSVFEMINYANNDTESLTGTKAFSQGIGSQALGNVATGIRSSLDATAKRELSILRRLSNNLFKDLAVKTIAMNQAFLDEEEVVRITNSEYVTVKRQDIKGEFDIIIDVSTPEKDSQEAQDLTFLLQTIGPNMDPGLQKVILGKIARLKKQPDLEQQILSFEPEPDPAQEELKKLALEEAELKIKKLKLEIADIAKGIESEDSKIAERNSRTAQNLQSETKENIATARLKNAQAMVLEEKADLAKLEFAQKADGTDRKRQLEDMELSHIAKKELESVKQKNNVNAVNTITTDNIIDDIEGTNDAYITSTIS